VTTLQRLMKYEYSNMLSIRSWKYLPAILVLLASFHPSVQAQEGLIPHAKVVQGSHNIVKVWLSGSTTRYGHSILGDSVEATTLSIELKDGSVLTAHAEDNSVFEDLTPRLIDIDQDGQDEVVTIQSDASSGARVVLFKVVDGELKLTLSTQPIGIGYRWLNPIGAADITGDNNIEIVYVETPHIGGIVTVVKPYGNKLIPVAEKRGYSNHAIGSTLQNLSLVSDLDSDGISEIIVPDQSRTAFAILYFIDGKLIEFWKSKQGPRIGGNVELISSEKMLTYLTTTNEVHSIELPTFNR
jgi:hypothetical protein